jgi:acyl carrier protein
MTNRDQIEDRLKSVLNKGCTVVFDNPSEIKENTSLINDLAMDSIQILELLVSIEEEFSFVCEPNEIDINMFEEFGSLVSFIETKINQ